MTCNNKQYNVSISLIPLHFSTPLYGSMHSCVQNYALNSILCLKAELQNCNIGS